MHSESEILICLGPQLPILEDRINRLERAVQGYLGYRGQLAIKNATVQGLDDEMDEDVDAVATPDEE